ncbi:MAG: hypothetical protein JWO79_1496, partial [Actinomycetia bacterium]|nr:hypothetical protein [Actinomycetes bacterium]
MTTGPRLRRGLVTVPAGDGLLAEGGPVRQLLTGSVARTALPRLLPLLDGSRTTAQIGPAAGLTPAQTTRALAVLAGRGLLDPGVPPEGPTGAYLTRNPLSARTAEDELTRLAGAAVAIAGPPSLAAPLAADLAAAGVGDVSIGARTTLAGYVPALDRLAAAPVAVAVLCGSALALAPRYAERGIRVLRVAAGPDAVEIGPLLGGPGNVCAECAGPASGDGGEPWHAFAAGLAATEVLALLGVGQPSSRRTVLRTPLPELGTERLAVTPRPGCCGLTGDSPARAHEWLATYAPPARRPGPVPARASSPRSTVDGVLADLLAAAARHNPELYLITDGGAFAYADGELTAVPATRPSCFGPGLSIAVVAAAGRLVASHGSLAFRAAHLRAGR